MGNKDFPAEVVAGIVSSLLDLSARLRYNFSCHGCTICAPACKSG